MIAGPDLHPAVADRLVTAAKIIHGQPGILQSSREYPKTESPPAPLNEVAEELINTGPNFLHAVLPYWIAAQFGRVLLLLLLYFFSLRFCGSFHPGMCGSRNAVSGVSIRNRSAGGRIGQARTLGDVDAVADSIEELDTALLTSTYRLPTVRSRMTRDCISI